jgi:hypothetical protein
VLKNHPEVLGVIALALLVGFRGEAPAPPLRVPSPDDAFAIRRLILPEAPLPRFGPARPLVDVPGLVREVLRAALNL